MCVFVQVYTYKQNAVSRQRVYPMHSSSINGVEDMATLLDLHDGAILHNLQLRYTQKSIYVSKHTAKSPTHTQYSIVCYSLSVHLYKWACVYECVNVSAVLKDAVVKVTALLCRWLDGFLFFNVSK